MRSRPDHEENVPLNQHTYRHLRALVNWSPCKKMLIQSINAERITKVERKIGRGSIRIGGRLEKKFGAELRKKKGEERVVVGRTEGEEGCVGQRKKKKSKKRKLYRMTCA
ncbi:unnamed protein product [Cuscuta epithymum]|uniref:Uncharacterized protein n=1 Tax=Cuscuta epithymum TaxID=186058 RepID=A0AAV0ESV6_9ASTE|nr:unnamed protein product [Cuscuta epithymum]